MQVPDKNASMESLVSTLTPIGVTLVPVLTLVASHSVLSGHIAVECTNLNVFLADFILSNVFICMNLRSDSQSQNFTAVNQLKFVISFIHQLKIA